MPSICTRQEEIMAKKTKKLAKAKGLSKVSNTTVKKIYE
jgi:hypothetical protein